jgi:NAD(P)-dependent dehydrogenase (short-subunit alcohol dehydrogenase family)
MRDKVVVVTGGFGVLGQAVAEAALAAEAYVAIPSREQESKIPVRDRLLVLGGVDLTDFAAAKQAFEEVATRFGRIPAYAKNLLPWSVVSRPLEGEAPTIDVAVGYSKANTSPILKLFLSRVDALVPKATSSTL